MTETQMKAAALRVAGEVARAHGQTEDEKRTLEKLLPGYFFAVMQEVRAQTVKEIAYVVERADPPESAADAPRVFAGAIRSTFGEG